MTAEEKEKLYTAIGYSGSSHNLALPKKVNTPAICMLVGFVDDKFKFNRVRCLCKGAFLF